MTTFDKRRLRHDRVVGIIVMLLIAAMLGLMIWLGSFSGSPEPMEYWPMMP